MSWRTEVRWRGGPIRELIHSQKMAFAAISRQFAQNNSERRERKRERETERERKRERERGQATILTCELAKIES